MQCEKSDEGVLFLSCPREKNVLKMPSILERSLNVFIWKLYELFGDFRSLFYDNYAQFATLLFC